MNRYLPFIKVLLAGILWGMIGIFVKGLNKLGFSSMEIVAIRASIAFLILFLGGLFFKRNELKIKFKDSYLFIGTGILSLLFFNWCYFTAINLLNISYAVILLYTAPAFVLVLSSIFLKEKFTAAKLLLILGVLLGCSLVAGISIGNTNHLSSKGVIFGLGSGLGYALYSIFGKAALKKYSSYTISLYTFLFAFVPIVPLTNFWTKIPGAFSVKFIFLIAGLGILSTVLAYLLYTSGLKNMDSSKASVLATIEPVTAMFIGYLFFKEDITYSQLMGSFLILLSVSLHSISNIKFWKRREEHNQFLN